MYEVKSDIIQQITYKYLRSVNRSNIVPKIIAGDLLKLFSDKISEHNVVCDKSDKWQSVQALPWYIISDILLQLYPIKKLSYNDVENVDETDCDLVMYQYDGPNKGLYVADQSIFYNLIGEYSPDINMRQRADILADMKNKAVLIHREQNKDLIAVSNGVYDYTNDELLDFSPDYVFTSKINTEYNCNAKDDKFAEVAVGGNIININDIVASWATDKNTGDVDKDIELLLWQIIGACVRNNVPWNMIVFLYSEQGSNGKGTFCQLVRNLIGLKRCSSLKIADFAADFKLAELTAKTVVLADENPTNAFNSDISNLKAAATGDILYVNRKYKSPITMCYKGLIVQCVNGLPKTKDQSESWYRRQLFVPFNNRFMGNDNNSDIKNQVISDKNVLEYVLYKVLHLPKYYKLSIPEASAKILNEYKSFNDPLQQFVSDIFSQLQWNLVPYQFLYDLYRSWFSKNCPQGQVQSRYSFTHDIKNILFDNDEWEVIDGPVKSTDKITCAEPLIDEYELEGWYNPTYHGNDINKKCMPMLKTLYRGLIRKK